MAWLLDNHDGKVRRVSVYWRVPSLFAQFICVVLCSAWAQGLWAENVNISTYGTPGIVDMPTAEVFEDGLLRPTLSYSKGMRKQTLAFQITPRITGAFRYSVLDEFDGTQTRYDRSFDFSYQILKETNWRPALAFGLRDFGGTGIYSSEYIVATKHILDNRLGVSAGIGWGRLAGVGAFSNPFGKLNDDLNERGAGPETINEVGRLEVDQWFRGDAALFGGITYQASDYLKLVAEYSSDAYKLEKSRMGFERESQFNLGFTYQFENGVELSGYSFYGREMGLLASFPIHPNRPPNGGRLGEAPPPILPARLRGRNNFNVDLEANTQVKSALSEQGIELYGLSTQKNLATVSIHNLKYSSPSQALGRAARVLVNVLPSHLTKYRVVLWENGMRTAAANFDKDDIVSLEHDIDGSRKILARTKVEDAKTVAAPHNIVRYPNLKFGIKPYIQSSLFDPDNPYRADFGLQADVHANLAPGLRFSGVLRQPVIGNLDEVTRRSNSILPHVRSDSGRYASEADLEIKNLMVEYFFRPGTNLYGRISAGYLEPMFGGLSAELLWYPADRQMALGLELNYARQRAFDQMLDFQDYDIVTSHGSIYYDFHNGFVGKIDIGKYLAGDWGTTVSLDRRFNNGVSIGAFFTLTDVPFDDFGEGSFDKGIKITIPVEWVRGRSSKDALTTVIRPVWRDGGARLEVPNRLYETVRGGHPRSLQEEWGMFWR